MNKLAAVGSEAEHLLIVTMSWDKDKVACQWLHIDGDVSKWVVSMHLQIKLV